VDLEATPAPSGGIAGGLTLADLEDTYPARDALFARLTAHGTAIEHVAAPQGSGVRYAARLADAADELRAAMAWAGRRVASNPLGRVAVVAGTSERLDELERLASTELGDTPCWSQGRALSAEPAIGAAFDAVTLCGAGAPYATFGRWLRSPFFAMPHEERYARTRLDAELRMELRSQLPFHAGYRCGLKELLEARAPVSARGLVAGLASVGSVRRATPGRWAYLWSRLLADLHWLPPSSSAPLRGWQATLDEMARLTPILGEISHDAALSELARLLERTIPAALPLRGVHVLQRIDDVGPGYDAVWVTGFTDTAWPEPPHGNPLLPLALQRALGMPYSTPGDAEQRSARAFARLLRRSHSLVVSWPGRVYDYETEPSPAIRAWPALPPAELEELTAATSLRSVARETVADPAPRFDRPSVAGGTGALGRQARCPIRAFCQDRLGARPLEALGFGVPARLRGIAAHHAAERLLEDLPEQSALAGKTSAVAASVEHALARTFGRARPYLRALYDLEAEQLTGVLLALLRAELQRAPFRVRAVEQQATVTLGPLTLVVRSDRTDELADGTVAIIDYKTGERASSADWFRDRLRDAQVPVYATASVAAVSAAVVARLTLTETRYSGFWPPGAFPGRPNPAADPDRHAQLRRWHEQLVALATEFAGGDTRFFVADYDDAAGSYAPLTRVFEQLALQRGGARRW
jgi:probable DNA repair protein